MIPLRATYRLQLSPDLGFADAAALVPQLAELGISHLYASPVAEAVAGSTHGYDVTRPDRLRSQLGGETGFAELCGVLEAHGMALIVDIVPNHLSVADPGANPLWWDVLRRGRASPAAPAFDIDWENQDDKVVLPVLETTPAESIAAGVVTVSGSGPERRIMVGSMALPVAAGTETLDLPELLDAQHYRLVRWRRQVRNVRRFFTIDDLVALRMEHEPAARLVDELPHRWYERGLIAGVRVDHVDGLAEPGRYLERLRHDLPGGWIGVEKILAPGERLPSHWPVDGTTGYDAMRLIDHVLIDPTGESELHRRWRELSGQRGSFGEIARQARHEVLAGDLEPDLARCARAAARAVPGLAADGATIDALAALTVELDRYRTYLPVQASDRRVVEDMAARAARRRPELATVIETLRSTIVGAGAGAGAERNDEPGHDEAAIAFVRRWQQLCAPVVAKGDEDRAFYRFHRLSALCEVGGSPEQFGIHPDEFHAELAWRAEHQPAALVAGSTHDTKRSEDVRAHLLVLSEIPQRWGELFDHVGDELSLLGDDAHPIDRYLAVQTAVAAWPISPDRLHAFSVKAAREAAERSSWTDPDAAYESALRRLAVAVVEDPRCAALIAAFANEIGGPGRANALAALTLRATMPGVPDVYQGCETWNDGLVDPDNRRAPAFGLLRKQIAAAASADAAAAWDDAVSGSIKTIVLRRLLELRRRRGAAFEPGASYRPVTVEGPAANRVISFVRGDDVVVVVGRWHARGALGEGDAVIDVDPGPWCDVLTGRTHRIDHPVPVASLLAPLPAAVLERR
ncbi:MAG: malto-oligosyltrehalose synthase [Acidimicrobiales bacterium]